MEQISFIEESVQDKIIKQMKKALKRKIIPGAKVVIDGDLRHIYTICNLSIGNNEQLQVLLIAESEQMSWNALSDRLTVVGFYK